MSVLNVLRRRPVKSDIRTVGASSGITIPQSGSSASAPPPLGPCTLLAKEREHLADAQKELYDLQTREHNQQEVIAHIQENISLLERHSWFEKLYEELRAREMTLDPASIAPELAGTVIRAREEGLLQK